MKQPLFPLPTLLMVHVLDDRLICYEIVVKFYCVSKKDFLRS